MKIFSLKTKKLVFGWGTGVGISAALFFNQTGLAGRCYSDFGSFNATEPCQKYGWPFVIGPNNLKIMDYSTASAVENYFFWIFVSVAALYVVKYFFYDRGPQKLQKLKTVL